MKPNYATKLDPAPRAAREAAPKDGPRFAPAREIETHRIKALIALLVLAGAYWLALRSSYLDLPVERAINSYANVSPIIDRLFFDLDTYFIFSGALLVALVWACWFGSAAPDRRARIIIGVALSIIAAGISRALQHLLATHPRPFYDPALGFHLPSVLSQTPLNTWDSFPSDHAAIFFGLAATIATLRPGLGLFAFLYLIFVESSRAFMGAHYPTDLIAGAALGAGVVWAAQGAYAVRVGRAIAGWERRSPSLFYFGAFLLSYEIAIIFSDIRSLLGGVSLLSELRHLLH